MKKAIFKRDNAIIWGSGITTLKKGIQVINIRNINLLFKYSLKNKKKDKNNIDLLTKYSV